MDRQVVKECLGYAALAGAVVVAGFTSHASISDVHERGTVSAITPAAEQREAVVLLAGDTMLSRAVGDAMVARNDWTWPFARIASVTREADLMFVNLETPVSAHGTVGGCAYCFRTDPSAVEGLLYAGVDIVTLANNHTFDYGEIALTDTLGHLASAGIAVTGAGHDRTEAVAPVVRTVGTTRVAFLSYTNLLPAASAAGPNRPGIAVYDETSAMHDIAAARLDADVVIVSFHAGDEYQTEPNDWQRRVFRSLIDAGADMVVGHHPHVIQPVESYGSGWIAYSLGNFVFDQTFSEETMQGLMLRVSVAAGRIIGVEELPILISRSFQPAIAETAVTR